MPAISSGIFGFPKDKYAKINVEESRVLDQNNNKACSIDIIEFCIFDNETLECFKTEFINVKAICCSLHVIQFFYPTYEGWILACI